MTDAFTLARPLAVGDRFELTDHGATQCRPCSATRAGVIVGEDGDYWRVIFDGTKPRRTLFRGYCRPTKEDHQ